MRCLLIVLLFAAAGSAAVAQAPSRAPADEAAVRDLVRRYTEARVANDPKAIAALFTPDADQYTSAGEWRRGLPQLVQGMLATSKQNPGVRGIDLRAVRFLTPDVAIADGDYRAGANDQPLWTTIVARRVGPGWLIEAIRNSAPR